MVIRDRTADEDLSEVVRRRLDALLAEIPPRRVLHRQPVDDGADELGGGPPATDRRAASVPANHASAQTQGQQPRRANPGADSPARSAPAGLGDHGAADRHARPRGTGVPALSTDAGPPFEPDHADPPARAALPGATPWRPLNDGELPWGLQDDAARWEADDADDNRAFARLAEVSPAAVPGVHGESGAQEVDASTAREDGTRIAARRLMPTLHGALASNARRFVREHLVVVGIIVLTGCVWGGWSLFQARSTPVAAAAAQPSVQVGTASPSPSTRILVHVLGEVRRPGVVTLTDGARVQDALDAAGGLTKRATPGQLNLAAAVTDGSQLVIGRNGSQVRATSSTAGAEPGAPAKLDLNAATLEQLDTLPGVGPVTAKKILTWREAHQRFRTVAELQEVDGIGPKSYAEIAAHVRV